LKKFDYLIVGAGFSGAVSARQLAEKGKTVLLMDKRNHTGGNAHDCYDSRGLLIHPYGPHIFHTNSKKIFSYLSQFTNWRFYEHRVLANINDTYYPIPINRTTINQVFSSNLTEDMVDSFLESKRVKFNSIKNSEELVLSSVGQELCDLFFKHYTFKQWGLHLNELSASVASRIPTRTNDDDRYFTDSYQFMPADGYHTLFNNLLNHPNIEIFLDVDFFNIKKSLTYEKLIYTGPIDSFYNFQYGKLPYRSLSFEHEHLNSVNLLQSVGTVNYPSPDKQFTRITEFKHLTGQQISGSSVVKEYPKAEGDPYYPIPNPKNEELFKKYKTLSEGETGVYFVGRLAEYRYYNMDQVVGAALALCEKLE